MKQIVVSGCFLFLFFSLLLGCQEKKKQDVQQSNDIGVVNNIKETYNKHFFRIDMVSALAHAKKKEFPPELLNCDVEYVPLETTRKSLINPSRRYFVSTVTDKIIVADMKLFDRMDGHYIGNLLTQGQGPEEYLSVMGVAADDNREEFYLLDNGKRVIHVVGYDNTYKGFMGVGDYTGMLYLGNGNILVCDPFSYAISRENFYIINADGKQKVYRHLWPDYDLKKDSVECKYMFREGSYIGIRGEIVNRYWLYQDKLHYFDALNDSIYSIDQDYKTEAIGFIETEKLRMTREQAKVGFMSRDFDYWGLRGISETSSHIFMKMYCHNVKTEKYVSYLVVYSKETDETTVFELDNKANAIDHGVQYVYGSNSKFRFISPESIQEYISRKGASYFTSEKAKRFKEMGDKLKFDDNHVVAIYK